MANTTSGTTTFEKGFSISDIVEEAYERLGIQGVSGYQLKSARRSLNILFQEWANRGLHYWEVANNSITLVADQATYTMFRATSDGTSDASISTLVGPLSRRRAGDLDGSRPTPPTRAGRRRPRGLRSAGRLPGYPPAEARQGTGRRLGHRGRKPG